MDANSPGSQSAQAAQLDAFVVVLNVPPAHAVHVRSIVVVPIDAAYCPAVQSVHDVQLEAFVVAVNVPPPHAEHVRSDVALPSVAT